MQRNEAYPPDRTTDPTNSMSDVTSVDSQSLDSEQEPRQVEDAGSRASTPSWMRNAALVLGFGTMAIASGLVGLALSLSLPLPERLASGETAEPPSLSELLKKGVRHRITRPVNILVMGIDEVPEAEANTDEVFAGRSDTMILAQINPDTQSVSLLSIPRDTQVEFPGRSQVSKINHANWIGGPRLAANVVSHNLGDVEIDRYVRFNTDSFKDLVDVLGGVEVFVPKPMQYEDQTQKLFIDLEQGWQVLDGEEAEQFARFRNDADGDIGRVQRQQVLLRALRDRLTTPSGIAKIPKILQLLQNNVDTNLATEEMLSLATFALDIEQNDLRMVMLPGRFSQQQEYAASYWLMEPNNVERVMQEYFGVSSVAYASNTVMDDGRAFRDLSIAVQNASSDPQGASEVARYLRSRGFNNVYLVRDWPEQNIQTQVIAQRGDLQGAGRVEDVLGVGEVVSASTGDLNSDFTIRVGNDWAQEPDLEL